LRFILVDRIEEVEKGKRVVGIKNVAMSEDWFRDHFPGDPVMPGVLLIETIAQTGAVLIDVTTDYALQAVMTAVEQAKFIRPVRPADQLTIEVELLQMNGFSAKVSGKIRRKGRKVAEAKLLYVLRNGNGPAAVYWKNVSKHLTANAIVSDGEGGLRISRDPGTPRRGSL
jgi:3-hydroxyacyl-[acyl-carrier-protein] dehydratase